MRFSSMHVLVSHAEARHLNGRTNLFRKMSSDSEGLSFVGVLLKRRAKRMIVELFTPTETPLPCKWQTTSMSDAPIEHRTHVADRSNLRDVSPQGPLFAPFV